MDGHESSSDEMMMRILILLVFIQTALMLVLFGKIAALEKEMLSLVPIETNTPADDLSPQRRTDDNFDDPLAKLGEGLLRKIIREELAALPWRESEPDLGMAARPAVDPAEMQDRHDSVDRQIDYYASVGQISDIEMIALQTEIAKLDSAGRREMLNKLTRAMNAGAIRGRL